MAKIQSVNPATEEINAEFDLMEKKDVVAIARKVRTAFGSWRSVSFADRAEHLRKLAGVLDKNKEQYARLITQEMGKPIRESRLEIEKCALTCTVYADQAEAWLQDDVIDAGPPRRMVVYQPLGTILEIMPWNFPFWQALRCAIPALMAGNVCLLRHSNSVPLCALEIEKACAAALPSDVFRTVLTDHTLIKFLIKSAQVQGVSLTGSVDAGANVAAQAGKQIKKVVLELGGSDPFVVLEDADVKLAAEKGVEARRLNTGQSCIAAKRFIVVTSVAEEFTRLFIEHTKQQKTGDPLSEDTTIGPMANKQQLEKISAQVLTAQQEGATIECGGNQVPGKGFFYQPTVITGVTKKMRIMQEEVFGPVATICVVKNEREALKFANDTEFGLGASVWTRDRTRGERFARQCEAGIVGVNSPVRSDPRLPFGGIKKSGIGRELGVQGIREFTNIKTFVIN